MESPLLADNKSGVVEVLRVGLPASASMLGRTMTQFVDGVMVARTGQAAFIGQGVGALVAFVPEAFSIGIIGVINTFVSQNLGAGRSRRCGQYAWAGLGICGILSAIFLPLFFLAKPLFSLINHAADVQINEVLYFRYMILAMPLTMSIRALESFFYGLHKPRVVVTISIFANAVNVVGNYVLIFGKFGMPAMGLKGAAIATVASWSLQFTILLIVFLSRNTHLRFGTRFVRAVRFSHFRDIFRVGWPAGISFFIDLTTWTVFTTLLVGHFGKTHLAAAQAAARYMTLSFMPAIGMSIATTALVGRYIGMGRRDLARKRAHCALRITMIYMGVCALIFFFFRHWLIGLFAHHNPVGLDKEVAMQEMIVVGGRIMICAAVFQLFDACNIIFNGALRGAGDTRWPMVVMFMLSTVVLVGGGTAMVIYLPQLKSLGPYIAATAWVVLLAPILTWRFESGAWRKINLLRK